VGNNVINAVTLNIMVTNDPWPRH